MAKYEQPFYGRLMQDNPGKPVLSQRRDLPVLKQPLGFYELDFLLPLKLLNL